MRVKPYTPPALLQVGVASAVMIIVICLLGGAKYFQIAAAIAQHAAFALPPEAVTTIVAKEESWKKIADAVGSLSPVQGVNLTSEEEGKVVKINFESGAKVEQGQVIVEMDTSVEEGNLKAALARLDKAQRNLTRVQALRATNAVSKEDLDNAESVFREAQGNVESLKGTIARKKIVAPFSGRTGIRMVNIGQYLAKGASIVPFHALNPLFVDFSLPQYLAGKVASGLEVTLSTDTIPGKIFSAKVTAVDPQVDPVTRTLKIQATVQNSDEVLKPGMFVRVQIFFPDEEKVIPLPGSSVSYAPYGDTVYVVETMKNPQGKEYKGIRQQVVKLGERRGDQIAILSGIKSGEEVVTSGTFKLRPNAAVLVNNVVTPSNNPAPHPSDT